MTPHTPQLDFVTQLGMELQNLSQLLWGTSLISLGLTVLIGWLLSRLVATGSQVAWRLGVDHRHRLQVVVRWSNLIIFVGVLALLLRSFFRTAPVMFGLLAITSAAGLVLALARPLQNAVGGAALILRGRVREGDHIELEGRAGTVSEVGLLRLTVRDAEGQTILIPNRLLQDRVVMVSRRTHLVPVVAQLALETPSRPAVEAARAAALLSPWRVAGTPARAWMDGDVLKVELQTWSDASVHPGREALERTLVAQQDQRTASRAIDKQRS
ncbi:MAG: mechanosensitive ion channel [Myxococcales bacterium]|nr:mechanosensitive ion channel [Myxococcales bacterium]